jgi:hypothetical protein
MNEQRVGTGGGERVQEEVSVRDHQVRLKR